MLVKMKDICTKVGSGATPKGGNNAYIKTGISLIRSQNIHDFYFSHDGLAHINDEQAAKLNGVRLEEDDVLLNITGDSVARACKVDNSVLPARVNQHVCIVRGDKRKVLSSYVLYYLQMKKPELLMMASSGATRNALTKGMIEELELDLPSLQEQKKIVSLLDDIQCKILNNNRINRNLSKQLEAIYKENIKNSELPASTVTLDELCSIFTGRKNANQNDEDGQYMFFTCGDTPLRINSYIYDGPAIIISGNGSYTGRTLFYNGKFDLYQRTYACTLKEGIVPEYIFGLYAILKIELHKEISGGTHGSSIPYIVMNDLAKFEFDINDDAFMEFSKQSKAILDTVMHNNAENEKLTTLRDNLLPKLMSGELDVSDLDI